MKQWNPDKKIAIEIQQCIDPAKGYEVWDVRDKDRSKCIERDADDEDIQYILMPDQYKKFQEGKGRFIVPAQILSNLFQYMY
jgi:hypothetical protein